MFLRISRNTKQQTTSLWYQKLTLPSRFRVGFNNTGGRSAATGKIVAHFKGRFKLKRVYYLADYTFNGFLTTAILLNVQRPSHKKSLNVLGLFFNSLCGWFLSKYPMAYSLFSYIRVKPIRKSAYLQSLRFNWCNALVNYPHYTQVCIFSSPKKNFKFLKAVRSPGTSAILLTPTFFKNWSLVLLPSKSFKILPGNDVYAHNGVVSLQWQKKIKLFKAGRGINMGLKPRVRGTVKNACDHPNGGRSRALRLSRTPWGVPTKKSRKPKLAAIICYSQEILKGLALKKNFEKYVYGFVVCGHSAVLNALENWGIFHISITEKWYIRVYFDD